MNEKFKAFLKRDFIYIALLLLALGSNLLVLNHLNQEVDRINMAWVHELQRLGLWDQYFVNGYQFHNISIEGMNIAIGRSVINNESQNSS